MPEIKVDAIVNLAGSGKPNLSVAPTVGSNAAISTLNTHSYTSSGTEPSSPKNGALWWDSGNDKVKVYIAGEFKEISLNATLPSPFSWGGDRGVRAGGNSASNVIDYWNMTSAGNAIDFGDLYGSVTDLRGTGNGTRALFFGGLTSGDNTDTIAYITTASTGNSTDFGNLTAKARYGAAGGDGTYAVFHHGRSGPASGYTTSNTIDYVTMATAANAADFGDLTVARRNVNSGEGQTRATFWGGIDGSSANQNVIDYVTVATPGNATDFGDISVGAARQEISVMSDATRTVGGGGSYQVDIEYITTDTTGNSTDFGDLGAERHNTPGCSNGTVGHFVGGSTYAASRSNQIDQITIQTTGNSTDFGDLTEGKRAAGAASGGAA